LTHDALEPLAPRLPPDGPRLKAGMTGELPANENPGNLAAAGVPMPASAPFKGGGAEAFDASFTEAA